MNERNALAFLRWPFWNDAERRPRALWRIAGFMLVAALVTALLSLAGAPRGGLDGSAGALVFAVRAVFTTTIAAVVAVRLLGRHPVRRLGIVPVPGFWGDLAFGLFLGAALMTLIFGFEYAMGWVRVEGFAYVQDPARSFPVLLAGMLFVSLCVGYYEELVSRGYLLREVAEGCAGRRVGPAAALVVGTLLSSALFASGHANNPNASMVSTVNIFFAGVMLAVPFVLTGRLAAPIGLHVTWNFFQSAIYGFPTSGFAPPASAVRIAQEGPETWTGGAFGPEAGVVGLAAMVLAIAAFAYREKWRTGRVEACADARGAAAAAGGQSRRQQLLQRIRRHRLREVIGEAGLAAAPPVVLLAVAGHGDDPDVAEARDLPNLPRHVVAGDVGQADVEQDDVRAELGRHPQGRDAVGGGPHLVAPQADERGHGLGRVLVVVHHQHAPAAP